MKRLPSIFSLFYSLKRIKMEVFFQLFSDLLKRKRSPSYPSWLVKRLLRGGRFKFFYRPLKYKKDYRIFVVSNSLMVTKRCDFDPFSTFQVEIIIHEKYSLVVMIGRFFRASFYTFSGPRDTTLWKRTSGVFFYVSFSNSLNMKKTPSFTCVRLIKLWRHWTHHYDETRASPP